MVEPVNWQLTGHSRRGGAAEQKRERGRGWKSRGAIETRSIREGVKIIRRKIRNEKKAGISKEARGDHIRSGQSRRTGARRRAWSRLWRRWEKGWQHLKGYGWSKIRMLGGGKSPRIPEEERIKRQLEKEIMHWEEDSYREWRKGEEPKSKTKAGNRGEGTQGTEERVDKAGIERPLEQIERMLGRTVTATEEGDAVTPEGRTKRGCPKERTLEDQREETDMEKEGEPQEQKQEEGELTGLLFAEVRKMQILKEGENREDKVIFITELLVDEIQREQGSATRMLRYALEMETEVREIQLIVKARGGRTEAARKWYIKMGFKEYKGPEGREGENDERLTYQPRRDGEQPEMYMYAEKEELMGKIKEREAANKEEGEIEETEWEEGTGRRQGKWRLGMRKGICRQKKDNTTWQEREAVRKMKSRHELEGVGVWREGMPVGAKESRCVFVWKEKEQGGGEGIKRGEKRKQDRKRGARWLAINVCGIHCTRRKEGEHEEVKEAGRNTLRLIESNKLREIMDIMTRARETVDMAILSDTHLSQEEMEDVKEILWKEAGLRAAGSPRTSELETEGEKAGILIVWDPEEVEMAMKGGEYAIDEVVKGRVVRMQGNMVRSKVEVAVYGTYMPVRQWSRNRVIPCWEALDEALWGEECPNIIMGGDWNAELNAFREKRGAKGAASTSDRMLQELVMEHGMTGQARGATYRAGTQIDNWFVNEGLAGSMGTADIIRGVCGDDHSGVVRQTSAMGKRRGGRDGRTQQREEEEARAVSSPQAKSVKVPPTTRKPEK